VGEAAEEPDGRVVRGVVMVVVVMDGEAWEEAGGWLLFLV
jgi:hypothetical protein